MKKIIITAIACAGLAFGIPVEAQATPDMCDNHMNEKDSAFGHASTGPDPIYVSGCAESGSGPDWENNAETPNVSTDVVGGMEPASPENGSHHGYEGTHNATQNIPDSDGLQADRVEDGNLFVPQPHT